MNWFAAASLPLLIASAPVSLAKADVKVAFIEFYTPDGRLIQLEPNGRFAHIAISYREGWLHAHPYRGVEWISTENLAKMGKIADVVDLAVAPAVDDETAQRFLGKAYDADFSWSDDKIYCSELVAKILRLSPEPMHFDPKLWPEKYWKFEGLPGLSPDKIYNRLKK